MEIIVGGFYKSSSVLNRMFYEVTKLESYHLNLITYNIYKIHLNEISTYTIYYNDKHAMDTECTEEDIERIKEMKAKRLIGLI